MLQIISGKFFAGTEGILEEEEDAILYSNYSWIAPIKTSVVEMRPTDAWGRRIASYVLRYTNRYQRESPQDNMRSAVSHEAVEQFRLLASFYFYAYFHVDRTHVQTLCRAGSSHSFDTTVPRAFVPRYFELGRQGTHEESASFVQFVAKVLGMPRKSYRLLISCLAGFLDALETLGNNFDLAYSILVYMFEALSKSAEKPKPDWDDYDDHIRRRLDKQLAVIDQAAADGIRTILLDNPHLKLKRRFRDFVSAHVSGSFFTSEAEGLQGAIAKSQLARAMDNLYDTRSGYVHDLKQVQHHLRITGIGTRGDVFTWFNDTHFTFAGLVRLARHVLMSFIERQPVIEHEDYPWRRELPGQVEFQWPPQYWAAQVGDFEPAQARQRFSGFVQYLISDFANSKPLLDMRPLLDRIEFLVASAKPKDRLPMLALYWLFNGMIPAQDRRPGWENFLIQRQADMEQCSIEWLATRAILGMDIPWPGNECVRAFEDYQRSRHKWAATHLPRLVEIAIMASIANRYLDASEHDSFRAWIDKGILDAAGDKRMQDLLHVCREKRMRIDMQHFFRWLKAASSQAASSDPPGNQKPRQAQ